MGLCLLYISIAYYMQKGGGWVQIACKIAYVLNGRPQMTLPAAAPIYYLCIMVPPCISSWIRNCIFLFDHLNLKWGMMAGISGPSNREEVVQMSPHVCNI